MKTLFALLILNVVSLSVLAGVGKGSAQKKAVSENSHKTSQQARQERPQSTDVEQNKSRRMPASSLPTPVTLPK